MISTEQISTSRLANQAARAMRAAFDRFEAEFREITQRGRQRFADRDWHGMQADSSQRLGVYASTVEDIVARVSEMLGHRVNSRLVWVSIKAVYSGLILDRDGWDIAETFFNSVTRRVFTTIGVDNEIEFVHTDYPSPPTPSRDTVFRRYDGPSTTDLLHNILADYPDLCLTEATIHRDAKAVADRIRERLSANGKQATADQTEMAAEMIKVIFYRGEYAFLIGRLMAGSETIPLVLCLRHTDRGADVDAVLTKEDDVSVLFSYTRSYLHVDVARPFDMVRFIKSIIPRKRSAEIYISLGYTRHGKTELYRNALRHLAHTKDKYQLAPGQRGMVMVVFTMPSYPVVFKIIKDHFDYPKDCSRQDVIDQYHLVFAHDRAGRLMDAQEYKYLVLDRHLFADELVEELLKVASQTVSVENDRVVIRHCYAERRVTPLNVYLQDASEEDARAAVIGYGDAIKDLALTNLFAGDLLLKNFGVTRKRRVVFYDYDEVCLLTDCNIRELPETGDYDDDMAAEPWYAVSKLDMFPQEFTYFLGLSPHLKAVFLEHHADLLDVGYWRDLQQQLSAGKLFHVAPYPEHKRLHSSSQAKRSAVA